MDFRAAYAYVEGDFTVIPFKEQKYLEAMTTVGAEVFPSCVRRKCLGSQCYAEVEFWITHAEQHLYADELQVIKFDDLFHRALARADLDFLGGDATIVNFLMDAVNAPSYAELNEIIKQDDKPRLRQMVCNIANEQQPTDKQTLIVLKCIDVDVRRRQPMM